MRESQTWSSINLRNQNKQKSKSKQKSSRPDYKSLDEETRQKKMNDWQMKKEMEEQLRTLLVGQAIQKIEEDKFEKKLEEDEKKKQSDDKVKEWLVNKKRQQLLDKYKDFIMLNAD